MKYCSSCGAKIENDYVQNCPVCGSTLSASVTSNSSVYGQSTMGNNSTKMTHDYPMKWYKFLIYFALFFGAVVNVINGIQYITGSIYTAQGNGVTAETVYRILGSELQTVDVMFGIAMIVIAAFGIFTRFQLANYKSSAPTCVYILYAAGAVATLAYNTGVYLVTDINEIFSSSSVISLIAAGVVIFLNHMYFTKRSELFTN